jgi:prolyl oligopeptidase
MLCTQESLPSSPARPVTEILHGREVIDPYRWLEDNISTETRNWLREQDLYTRAYFNSLPDREVIGNRLVELIAPCTESTPWKVGDRYFYLKRLTGNDQPVIVWRDGLNGSETILIDPALRGTGKVTAVAPCAISNDGQMMAYTVRQGGTDQAAIEILDVDRRQVIDDRLEQGLCTGFVFAPDNSGFFYSHSAVSSAEGSRRSVRWHRFGTECSADRELFCSGDQPNLVLAMLHSYEARVLIHIVFYPDTHPKTSMYVQSMDPTAASTPLFESTECVVVPFFVQGHLFAFTNYAALNFRIVQIDMGHASPENWRTLIPESDRRIHQFAVANDQIYVTYVDHFSTKLEAFSLDGERSGIDVPPHSSVELSPQAHPTNKLFFSVSSLSEPPRIWCYDAQKRTRSIWSSTDITTSAIEVNEVSYNSRDGVVVPLLLAFSKNTLATGPRPTFLSGYGGFGASITPRFSVFAHYLMEQGFLFATPALRGGSELGEQWHEAAKGHNRQKAFDDFITAAEWLVEQKYSDPHRIAIGGGSNAGLLVGAAVTQRPDLFKAAICMGALLDMIRYDQFDLAALWTEEYGSPSDRTDFEALLAYSPYHRIVEGTEYPAVLFVSGDADTRCNPMHTRKMVARLQAATTSGLPVLLDYRSTWGHMPVQPRSTKIQALTDRLAFVCHALDVRVKAKGDL